MKQDDGTYQHVLRPYGEGVDKEILISLYVDIEDAYSDLLSGGEIDRLEREGKVPVIRDGKKVYESLTDISLRDLLWCWIRSSS